MFQIKNITDLGILVLAVPVPQSCVSSKSCGSSQSTREPGCKSTSQPATRKGPAALGEAIIYAAPGQGPAARRRKVFFPNNPSQDSPKEIPPIPALSRVPPRSQKSDFFACAAEKYNKDHFLTEKCSPRGPRGGPDIRRPCRCL